MKLLTQTGLYYFLLSLIIMSLGALLFYKSLVKYVDGSSTGELYVLQHKVTLELTTIDSIPFDTWLPNHQMQFKKIALTDTVISSVSDTEFLNLNSHRQEPYRALRFNAHSRLYNYDITLAQSQVAGDDLVEVIIKSVGVMIALLFVLLFIINQTISKQIWKPFYHTLQQLRLFDMQQGSEMKTVSSTIQEFKELNQALEQMTAKIQADYRNLKEFTENASHEIQTPLAVIRAKTELLLQAENLTEQQWKQLSEINEATDRLSRLNHSLLLLAKIENGQFTQTEKVNLSLMLQKHIENLSEFIDDKNISVTQQIASHMVVYIHPQLLDILLSNLLMNAIRHNVEGGFIAIKLQSGLLSIQNSGLQLILPASELFNRFQKGSNQSSSTGIGLSIVQKIAVSNQMKISYTCVNKTHHIQLHF